MCSKGWLIGAVMFLIGCGGAHPIELNVNGFTEQKKSVVEAAAVKWSEIASRDFVRGEDGWTVVPFTPDRTKGYIGQAIGDIKLILIDPELVVPDDMKLYRVSLHELGHALGMDHVPESGNVMCGHPSRPGADYGPPDLECGDIPLEFGPGDRRELRRIGRLRDDL